MTTAIMEGAWKVLEESYLNSPSGSESPDKGNLAGRKASPHWSFYLLAAGTVAAAVAIVAGVILHMHYFILAGAFFVITNGISTITTTSLKTCCKCPAWFNCWQNASLT